MYYKRFCVVVVSAVTLVALGSQVLAEKPETVSITFGLRFDLSALADSDEDGIPELPDLAGEETIGVLIEGGLDGAENLHFEVGSAPCGEYAVEDTQWTGGLPTKVIVKGRPVPALGYGRPPEHTFLKAENMFVHGVCWVRFDADGDAIVQEAYGPIPASAVFAIVTGEFQLKR